MKRILTALTVFVFLLATTPTAFATDYGVELIVPDGKKSRETDVILKFNEKTLEIIPEKAEYRQFAKTFKYSDIKVADYSFSKKPMLSGGGAIATALLVGFIFAIPFLFMKKKNHWLSLQTEKEFAVLKLDPSNFRAIKAEMGTHDIKVSDVKDEEPK